MKKFIHLAVAVTVAGAALLATAGPASAHVSIEEGDQQPGAYTILTFGVPHGCEGSPTTMIEIEVPEPILSVTPTRSPYYDVEVETEELDEPITGPHGEEITQRDASSSTRPPIPCPMTSVTASSSHFRSLKRLQETPCISRPCRPAKRARLRGSSSRPKATTAPNWTNRHPR